MLNYHENMQHFSQWKTESTDRLMKLAQHLCAHLHTTARKTLQENLKTLPHLLDNGTVPIRPIQQVSHHDQA